MGDSAMTMGRGAATAPPKPKGVLTMGSAEGVQPLPGAIPATSGGTGNSAKLGGGAGAGAKKKPGTAMAALGQGA